MYMYSPKHISKVAPLAYCLVGRVIIDMSRPRVFRKIEGLSQRVNFLAATFQMVELGQ